MTAWVLGILACNKVPIHDVDAGFVIADASWFADEETLFVFYEVSADQGLSREHSVIEVTYTTDDGTVGWTDLSSFDTVHSHLTVDCGADTLCGSTSVHVPLEPRDVQVRLRYHEDGELSLDADTVFNVVDHGAPYSHRSLLVYGVFDEANARVQWRSRHQFPTLRNEDAEALGLRRDFWVRDQRYGTATLGTDDNPYGYGVTCPASYAPTDVPDVHTNERAVFDVEDLPLGASDASSVCAEATVTDATGAFTTGAVAKKNPEVRAAFPVLESPIRDATPIPFFLAPCDRVISAEHEAMQRQRLLVGDLATTCLDDWRSPEFVDGLVVAFRAAVEAERPAGNDMVLIVGLHQDETGAVTAVEDALAQVVPGERDRSSPRLAGAFVFDSDIRGLGQKDLQDVTLWCPSTFSTDPIPDASSRTCAVAPDNPDFELGPFSFGALPILPSRDQYLEFIDTYSDAQAGEVTDLTFRTPEFATTSEHVDIGDYGVVTFLDDELVSADADDAFSYCTSDQPDVVVFRSAVMESEEFLDVVESKCASDDAPEDFCAFAEQGVVPLEWLPDWHDAFRESSYDLGIFWDFPYLMHMEYQTFAAGALDAFGFTVPFGFADSTESFYGTEVWAADEYVLEDLLLQCRRFCDHPTFDSAGVYHVTDAFRTTYAHACYLPAYPAPGDSGFPLDP
jgi:hypothetical protein